MVIELCVAQFWSEIILVISNRTRAILKSRVWFQTKLHSTHFNYHYESLDNAIDWPMISLAIMVYEPLYHAHHICNICSWKSVVFTNNVALPEIVDISRPWLIVSGISFPNGGQKRSSSGKAYPLRFFKIIWALWVRFTRKKAGIKHLARKC